MMKSDLNNLRIKLSVDLWERHRDIFQLIIGVHERLSYVTPIAGCQSPQVRVFGGAIRDAYWGVTSRDVNVEVYGVMPIVLWDLLAESFPGLVTLEDTRYQHLELSLAGGFTMSFQVPRAGIVYEPYAHGNPRITPEESSKLRDFTFNSISYDIVHDVVHDDCDGIRSLESSQIEVCSDDRALRDPEMPLRVLNLSKWAPLTLSASALQLLKENVRRNYPLPTSLYKLTISNLRNFLVTGGSIDEFISLVESLELSNYLFSNLTTDYEIRRDRLRRIWKTGMIQRLQGIKQLSAFLLPGLLPSDLGAINYEELKQSLRGLTHLQISAIQQDYVTRVARRISAECHNEEEFIDFFGSALAGDESNAGHVASGRDWQLRNLRTVASVRDAPFDALPNPFDFESAFLVNASGASIQPGALAAIDKNENCIVRFDICNDYTVHLADIEDRGDLYQYHVQRVECMTELLRRILLFMKSKGAECGNFPMWIHVNDGTPPVRSVPIFCYALPLGFDNGILFPDWSFVDGYNCDIRGDWDTYRHVSEASYRRAPSWEDREGKFFFSGRDSTKKLGIRNLFSKFPDDIFAIHIGDDDNYDSASDLMVGVEKWPTYRYLLDLPGAYPWSVRFKELFLYGGVVVKVDLIDSLRRRPRWVNFYNSFFEEGRHYFRFDLGHSGDPDEDLDSIKCLKGQLYSLHYQLENDLGHGSEVARMGRERANELTLDRVIAYCAYLLQKYRNMYFVS
jgi:hypothetical protein